MLAAPTVKRRAYTMEEAMHALRIDRARIYRMIAEGTLRTYKHGRRRFVSVEAIEECIRQLERETAESA